MRWVYTDAISLITEDLNNFSMWTKGCHCHPFEKGKGRTTGCPWTGCRAPELAGRLAYTLAQLTAARNTLPEKNFNPELMREMVKALTVAQADLQAKFHWVNEPPYLVWQVPHGWMTLMAMTRLT